MLGTGLKTNRVQMRNKIKRKIRTEKVNIQTANTKANASEFLFFPPAHYLETIFFNAQMAHLQNRTSQPTAQVLQKSHFLAMH
jgi:hypothetical protein